MNKKALWIGLSAGLLVILLLLSILVYLIVAAPEVNELSLIVEPVEEVNYNNYLGNNRVDYKGGRFAWQTVSNLSPQLISLTDSGEISKLNGVNTPFQLLEDRVVSVDHGVLRYRRLDGAEPETIADDVSQFIATEDGVFYLTEGVLMQDSWQNGSTKSLGKNIECFFIRQDQICAVDAEGQISRLEQDGTWTKLCAVEISGYPFSVMPLGDYVLYEEQSQICFVDLATGTVKTVVVSDHRLATNFVPFICDDSRLFVSFQATSVDGSIVTKEAHPDNGVWAIDPQTKEKKKICDDAFEQLYLFEGNRLFGVRDNELFRVDIGTGKVTQVSG